MTRGSWVQLPESVRAAIEGVAGSVHRAEAATAGRNSDFSATLHTRSGSVFCKGIADAEGERGRMHRHEAEVNRWLPPRVVPRMRWRIEVDGWLLLGFDRAEGRHADLSPGSPDLPPVAASVDALVRGLAGSQARAPRLAEQWGRLAAWRRLAQDVPVELDGWTRARLDRLVRWEARAIELADGDSLVHTDLHALNVLVGDDRARVVDWAWSRTGAAAVDVAFLVARLVAAGHSPAEAELWAEALTGWRDTPPDTRTAFAVAIWGIWTYQRARDPRPLWNQLAPAARAWARHRLVL